MAKLVKNTAPILLFRNLLRLAGKWPQETDREGRSMREFMRNTIKEEFRRNKDVTSREEITKLLNAGKEEYKVLHDLYSKKFIKEVHHLVKNLIFKYPIRDYPVPDLVAKSKKLLSSDEQKKQKIKTKGLFRTLLEKLQRKKEA